MATTMAVTHVESILIAMVSMMLTTQLIMMMMALIMIKRATITGSWWAANRCQAYGEHSTQQSTAGDSWGGRRREKETSSLRVNKGGGTVDTILWKLLSSLKSTPNLQYTLPGAERGPQPSPHASSRGSSPEIPPPFFLFWREPLFFEARNLQKINRLPTDQQQVATSFLTS